MCATLGEFAYIYIYVFVECVLQKPAIAARNKEEPHRVPSVCDINGSKIKLTTENMKDGNYFIRNKCAFFRFRNNGRIKLQQLQLKV